jgi:CubicO group peptidase (beta-lactamase class C family)
MNSNNTQNIIAKKDGFSADLEISIPGIMEKALIPGLSIAVIQDGKLFWENGFGVKNCQTQDSVDNETVYEAASLSKPVFSYAVMKMIEKDELDLDKPLIEYVSDKYIEENFLGRKIDDARFKVIAARHVLSHKTGFPNWRGQNPLTIDFDPGDKFSYSGEGFEYLRNVVEKIKRESFENVIQREVFKPLGMNHSCYTWLNNGEPNVAQPHGIMRDVGKKRELKGGNSAGSLHTTVSDYAKFIVAILNKKGLSKSMYEMMLSPQASVPDESDGIAWGLGVGLQKNEDGITFWHWGDNRNFKCFFMASPEKKAGMVYFTNSCYGLTVRKQLVQLVISGHHPIMDSILLRNYSDVNLPWMDFMCVLVNEGIDEALIKLDELRKRLPATEILQEGLVNRIGCYYMDKKQYKNATKIFRLNTEIYPDSWRVHNSLGDALRENGDEELAVQSYEKSLQLEKSTLAQ